MDSELKRKVNGLLAESGKCCEASISQLHSYNLVERSTIRYTLRIVSVWMRKRRLSKLRQESEQALKALHSGNDQPAIIYLRKVAGMRGPIQSAFVSGKESISLPLRMKVLVKKLRLQ